ncbi:hypothetical protein [Legionella oakridgensis]|uniref:Phage minor tail protein n=2 Tax=Legionella oakridgensis TaxID=29423 RepID=W0BCY1_9GAMM|nr:hypothetical protein [Legionella oakridgensis]AHE66244.1 hypothetical protein Loa_00675 [Legionella oakridgensis ATCC 33761 = DSM 21215]ETO93959.1 hypothetical protein LOR_88c24740 [Legionella oakridgensis RV-2-2007]KTD44762.1 phage minor tail protein [Legionella oakridgensis]STY16144.1 phage minor tail protein [Legionella longbeachae]
MFISQLKSKIKAYDPYGEHHTNALKALLVLEILFLFNFIYTIPDAYFYYFYVPLTAFAAEISGNTLQEKYLFLFFTLMGSTIAIFLFGLLSEYKLFFIFFVFFFSIIIYYIAIRKVKSMFVAAPLILSLAAYSLIYGDTNSNFYIALNHAFYTIIATILIFIGLYFFPKRYYFAIWRRAFCEVLETLASISEKIYKQEINTIPIFSGIIVMERYSHMLSRRMKYYSILKITLLTFDLIMAMSYACSFRKQIHLHYFILVQKQLTKLAEACRNKHPIPMTSRDLEMLQHTNMLRTVRALILSWNHLCHNAS